MFLPIGDDIQKRNLPIVGILLISFNALVFVYSERLWQESMPREFANLAALKAFDIHQTPYGKFMDEWGLVPAKLAKGDAIGLGTHMFIHGDVMHLVGNMFMLWALVSTLENAMGSLNFLCYYLLWGLVAGLSHAGMNWGEKLPMIGASGAIAGMLGCYFILFGALAKIRSILWIWFRIYKINVPAGVYALVWLLLQFASIDLAAKVGDDHVAYWAHVGGFASGALIGLFLRADVHSRLALSREGTLEFKNERKMANEAEGSELATNASEATPAAANEPPVCPHCGTLVTEEHRIADTMFRCPKEGCKRLVFMQ